MQKPAMGILCLVAIAGCGVGPVEAAKARHAKQFRCELGVLRAEKIQSGTFVVDGCGPRVTYNCSSGHPGDSWCDMESVENNGSISVSK